MTAILPQRAFENIYYALMACPSCTFQRLQFLKRTPLYRPSLRLGISNDEIRRTVKQKFTGSTVIINSSEDEKKLHNREAINKLLDADVVGFDTETKPEYKLGKKNTNRVALIQVSTNDVAILWRLHNSSHGNTPEFLRHILGNRNILKVGHAVHYEVEELYRQYSIEIKNIIDTQSIAKELGSPRFALTALTAMFCGWSITKSQQRSNWERYTLTQEQVSYAATDAWATLQTYHQMKRIMDALHLDLPATINSSLKLVLDKDSEHDREMWKKMDRTFLDEYGKRAGRRKKGASKEDAIAEDDIRKRYASLIAKQKLAAPVKEDARSSGASMNFSLPPSHSSRRRSTSDLEAFDELLWNIKDFDRDVWLWAADKGGAAKF